MDMRMDKKTKLLQQIRNLLQEQPNRKAYRRIFIIMKRCPLDIVDLYVDYIIESTSSWPVETRRLCLELEDLANAPKPCLKLASLVDIDYPKKFLGRLRKKYSERDNLRYPDFDMDFGLPHTKEIRLYTIHNRAILSVLTHQDTNPEAIHFGYHWSKEQAQFVVSSYKHYFTSNLEKLKD
jgi:hypothetical protein